MALQLTSNGALYIDPTPETSNDNFTVAMWVKMTNLAVASTPWMNGHGGGFGQGYTTLISDTGKLAVDIAYVAYNETTTYDIADGNWHWIAYQRDAGSWKFYLDSSTAESVGTQSPFSMSADSGMVVGGSMENGSIVPGFEGHIAEVGYWTSVLSSANLASLAAGAYPNTIGTPYVYLPLDDDLDFEVNDGTGGDFTRTGTLTESTHPPMGGGGTPAAPKGGDILLLGVG